MLNTVFIRLNFDGRHYLVSRALATLLLLLLPLPGPAHATPTGTTVSNQVVLDFEAAGLPRQVFSNIDTFITEALVDVAISKSATVIADGRSCTTPPCDPVPGATIRYTLAVDVTGSGTASNLVITDSVPANTQYSTASITLDSVPLTDSSGDDPGSFNGNLVSVDLGDVAGPASFVITLDVTIN